MKSVPKKKILFLDHSLELGGAELSLLDILDPPFYIREKIDCLAVTFGAGNFANSLKERRIPCLSLNASKSFLGIKREGGLLGAMRGILIAFGLARQIQKKAGHFDIIHCNSQKSFVVGCFLSWISGSPVFWHLRDILTPKHFSKVQIFLLIRLANLSKARIIANSRATAEAFAAAGGTRSHTQVVYNGISIPEAKTQKPPLLSQLKPNAIVLGVFSRISQWKGQEIAIRALALIPHAHLLIVGAPLFGETEYEKTLKDLTVSLNLSERVHFLGFQRNIWPYMHACHYILHTSIEAEPFGRVIVEGMLCEKVVLAPKEGGPREIIDHLETGILYKPNSIEDLVRWITLLEADESLRTKLSKNAAIAAEKKFSRERMILETYQAMGAI